MTEPEPQQDDLTDEPGEQLVERTDNGLRPEDPPEDEQPSQDPAHLPEGTETVLGVVEDDGK